MQERVEAFIRKCEEEKLEKEERAWQKYHDAVLRYAGLANNQWQMTEVTKEEYDRSIYYREKRNGKYYTEMRIPFEITEEEFAAVEKAIPREKLAELRMQAAETETETAVEDRSWAGSFLTGMAVLCWIGAIIILLVDISQTSAVVTCVITGGFALCAAELFKKLQTIVNLMKREKAV